MILLKKVADPALVITSLGVAFVGSYATIVLYEIFRLCCKYNHYKILSANSMLIYTSLCLGGVVIWCMHFVGMQAISIQDEDGNTYEIRFDIALTMVSLVVVILLVYAGLLISASNKIFTREKADAVENFIKDARNKTITQIRQMSTRNQFLLLTLTESLQNIVLGGVVTALGVCVMHYLGMQAIIFNGEIKWNVGIIAASVIIAVVAASAAYWILFRLLSLFPFVESLRLICSIIMSIAVNGMHYTGMAAAEFYAYDSTTAIAASSRTMSAVTATEVALWIASCVLSLGFIIAIADLRDRYYSVLMTLCELDKIAETLDDCNDLESAKFLDIYKEARITKNLNLKDIKRMITSHRTDNTDREGRKGSRESRANSNLSLNNDEGHRDISEAAKKISNMIASELTTTRPAEV